MLTLRFLDQENAFASIQVAVCGKMDARALGNAFDAVWPDEDIDTFGLPALGLSPLTDQDNHEMSKMAMEMFDFECDWELAFNEQAEAKPKDLAQHRLKKDRAVALTKPLKSAKSSSKWRGVTRHKITSRFEAHIWDANFERKPSSSRRRGKQIYLGGWKHELEAARAYDLALLKFFGPQEPCSGNSPQEELFHKLNFPEEDYSEEIKTMQEYSCADWVAQIRRRSSGFARGVSAFRGVTSHKGKNSKGRWEARIGRVLGNQYIYLGTYKTELEAARSYDIAAISFRGEKAVTNFPISNYTEEEIARAKLGAKISEAKKR